MLIFEVARFTEELKADATRLKGLVLPITLRGWHNGAVTIIEVRSAYRVERAEGTVDLQLTAAFSSMYPSRAARDAVVACEHLVTTALRHGVRVSGWLDASEVVPRSPADRPTPLEKKNGSPAEEKKD